MAAIQASVATTPITSVGVDAATGLEDAPPPLMNEAPSVLAEPSSKESASLVEQLSGGGTGQSTSRSHKSSTRRSGRWRNEASPPRDVLNMWRTGPGILRGDKAYSKDPLEDVKSQREAELRKRLAGEFVVSAMVNRIELPPPPPSRTLPTLSPYDDAWRCGVAPVGRWVLERGRPRWVTELPSMSLTQSSVEAWFSGYKDPLLPDAASESLIQTTSDAGWVDTGEANSEVMTKKASNRASLEDEDKFQQTRSGSSASDGVKSASSDEVVKERQASKKMSFAAGSDTMKRTSSLKKPKSKRQSRQSQLGADDGLETVDDILRSLDLASAKTENCDAMPRFQWVPLSPRAGARGATSVLPSGHSVVASGQGDASIGVKSSRQFRREQVSKIKKGLISLNGSKSARQPPRPGDSHMSGVSTHSKKSVPSSRKETSNSLSSTLQRNVAESVARGGSDPGARNHDRNQRTELRRLNQSLMNSAQHAFDADVWDACGIEAEHLKKHQFASLIQSGLFKIGGHKDEENAEQPEEPADDSADAEAAKQDNDRTPMTRHSKSHSRKTMNKMGKLLGIVDS